MCLVLSSSSLARIGRLGLHSLMKMRRVRLIRGGRSFVAVQEEFGRRSLIYSESER